MSLVVCPPIAEENRTSKASESELMQCQRQRDDLDLMLHTVARGYFLHSSFWNHATFLSCLSPCATISPPADSRCKLCPAGWSWWMGRCLFFSVGLQENRQWNESAEFCRQHNSSLVVIKDAAEMVVLMEMGNVRRLDEVEKTYHREMQINVKKFRNNRNRFLTI